MIRFTRLVLVIVVGVNNPAFKVKQLVTSEPVTGVVADIGKIVSNFPDIAALSVGDKKLLPTFTRAGAGGALGGIIGSAIGTPFVGGPIGAVIGAGTSEIIRRVAANKMASPSFQSSRAIPKDYRPQQPTNNLTPPNRNSLRP